MPERTVLDFYRHEVDSPRAEHYSHWTPQGRRVVSTEQFFDRTAALSRALSKLGVETGDRVMMLSDNRPEWHMTDMAALALGAVDVPIYGTLTLEQIRYQVNDSGAKIAVVEDPGQMAKFLAIRKKCRGLEHLVQIEGAREKGVLSFDELVEDGSGGDGEAAFWDGASRVQPEDLMTIIYTSGTTGEPKGVMLTHDNLVQNVLAACDRVQIKREGLALELLPLCHVFERMFGYCYMYREVTKAYCSVHHVGELISQIRPTLFAAVPRLYEKIMQKITDKVAGSPPVKRALFKWAVDTGSAASRLRLVGQKLPVGLAAKHALADKLVLSKVREAFGGRLEFCASGGAALPLFVNEFFHSLGVYVIEGYGLTETSPIVTANGTEPGQIRLGTIGKPLRDVEIRLDKDGELLTKGPNVMQGYWNKPDQTEEVFTEDGYFRTGDIAEVDDDGFVLIVDRKKDLIVTAGGKNVAPQPIESELKKSKYIETAVLIGDRRPYIIALVSPSFEDLTRWAKKNRIEWSDHRELASLPQVAELIGEAITRINGSLARYEQIKKIQVLPIALSIEGGQLTPTLKVKRRVVEQQFSELIGELYE